MKIQKDHLIKIKLPENYHCPFEVSRRFMTCEKPTYYVEYQEDHREFKVVDISDRWHMGYQFWILFGFMEHYVTCNSLSENEHSIGIENVKTEYESVFNVMIEKEVFPHLYSEKEFYKLLEGEGVTVSKEQKIHLDREFSYWKKGEQ